jgi:hypothetical protein
MMMPSVTVCPNYYVSKRSTQSNYENFTFDVYAEIMPIIEGRATLEDIVSDEIMNFLRTETVADFYYKTGFEDIFVLCFIFDKLVNCSDYISLSLTEHGICYSFHSLTYITKHHALYAKAPVKSQSFTFLLFVEKEDTLGTSFGEGLNIAIDHPESYPLPRQHSIKLAPGFETYVALKMYETEYLKPPYSHQECVNQEDLNSTYDRYKHGTKYSPEKCNVFCYNELLYRSVCNFTKEKVNNTCTMYDFLHTALPNTNTVEEEVIEKCQHCLPLCNNKGYEMKISSARYPNNPAVTKAKLFNLTYTTKEEMAENYAVLNVFFESFDKKLMIQQPAQSIEDLLSQLGGMMGLCLGASIITAVEWLQYLICVVLNYFSRVGSQTRKPTKIDEKPNYF